MSTGLSELFHDGYKLVVNEVSVVKSKKLVSRTKKSNCAMD